MGPHPASVVDALVRVLLDEQVESAVAAIDWALHTAIVDPEDLERAADRLPLSCRKALEATDPHCESLPESLARTRLVALGFGVASQVPISGGRIDLVINGTVALETDGEEFHRDSFEQDRRKDLAMILAGYLPIRVPARLVFHEWDTVVRVITTATDWRMSSLSATQERSASLSVLSAPLPDKETVRVR